MRYRSGSSRYLKLLGAAWVGFLLIGDGVIAAFGPAAIFALFTWIVIRKSPPEDFSINTKPTFVMLAVVAILGWGKIGHDLLAAGASPNHAVIAGLASLPGVLLVVALIGIKVAPQISYVVESGVYDAQD